MRSMTLLCLGVLILSGCTRAGNSPSSSQSLENGATTPPKGAKIGPSDLSEKAAGADVREQLPTDRIEAWDGWELTLDHETVGKFLAVARDAAWHSNKAMPFAFADYYISVSDSSGEALLLQLFMPGRIDQIASHALKGGTFPTGYRLDDGAALGGLCSSVANLRARKPLGDDELDKNAVLHAGDTIEIRNRHGTLRIQADSNRKRTYTWDGISRSVFLRARREPWYGALGLYFPGTGDHWKEHRGVTRGVLREETTDFPTLAEFETWLKDQQDWYDAKHTPDGMVAGWSINLERQQLNVEVHRITIAGKRPAPLKGGTSDWLTWAKAGD